MLNKALVLVIMSSFLIACSAPVQKSFLNLNYDAPNTKSEVVNVKLAIVKPKYSQNNAVPKQTQNNVQVSAVNAIINKQLEKSLPVDFKVNRKFNSEISPSLENSIFSDTESIVKAKGFRVIASAVSEDEITYSQKKTIDLVIVPEFDISPSISVIKPQNCNVMPIVGYTCSDEEGTITLAGKLYLNFIEPMSREKILIKSVDISSLSKSGLLTQTSYIGYEQAENALINTLNNAYPALMERVAMTIDSDEIMSTVSDINRLKEKNK